MKQRQIKFCFSLMGHLVLGSFLGYPLQAQELPLETIFLTDVFSSTTEEKITISENTEIEITNSELTELAPNSELTDLFLGADIAKESSQITNSVKPVALGQTGGLSTSSEQETQTLSQSTEPIPDSILDWNEPIEDEQIFWLILVDKLEYRANDGQDTFNWEAISWVGGDYQRIWIKTEGEVGLEDGDGEAEIQLLYGQLISPFFDLQVGVRYDQLYGEDTRGRAFGVIGLQGLLPYLFEVDASLFVSQAGDISARFSAEQQLLVSQRLFLEPSLETNLAIQEVEEFGVGSGINDLELSLRLRYEFNRRFAPYVGVSWTRLFGETADFASEEGESVDDFAVFGGVRLLF
ncbi:copper resistance protein B [Oscillatoria salina]|uniref:copper resistance protein B n=1 Tax=Oscillatoria salina TaxID=331517 RepID=UPI001CCEF091|nr:copper resistance protein B [Oscillatoria salina]